MRKVFVVVAALSSLLASASAQAQVKTYDVSGSFQNGQTFAGSFSFDPTKNDFNQYSNVSISLSNYSGVLDHLGGLSYGYSDPNLFTLFFDQSATGGRYSIELGFDATYSVNGYSTSLKSIDGPSPIVTQSFLYTQPAGGSSSLVSGSITEAGSVMAAVPEPGTWLMMIVGMGVAGYAMRRRQQVATRLAPAA